MCLNMWRAKGGHQGIEKSERKLPCVFFILILITGKRRQKDTLVDIEALARRAHTHTHTHTHTLGEKHPNYVNIVFNFKKRMLIGRSHENGTVVPLYFISNTKGPFTMHDYECECDSDIANYEVISRYLINDF